MLILLLLFVFCVIGSMSLHLGNEIFDIHQMPLQGDFNHLFIRQGTGLQGQAVFKTKLTFRSVILLLLLITSYSIVTVVNLYVIILLLLLIISYCVVTVVNYVL